MPSSTMVARVRRVSERLDEMNFRLRILRDPFHATTIAGQRLVEKEKTRNSAAEPAGASRRRQSVISPRRELLGQSSGVNARTQNAVARIPVGSPNDKTHS